MNTDNFPEKWKDIKGYEKIYQISNRGEVRRIYGCQGTQRGKILKPQLKNNGYYTVSLSSHSIIEYKGIAQLVAEAFIGLKPENYQINHLNGIKTDNRVENLEWCTPGENLKHALDTKLRKRKIPKEEYNLIYQYRKEGRSLQNIADQYGVTKQAIASICKKKIRG